METLFAAPYILRVLVSLFIILAVNRAIKQLYIAVIIGTAVLALWCGHSPSAAAAVSWQRVSSFNTLFFGLIVFQVIWLSSQMSETGVMKDLVDTVRKRTSQRASMALLPAIIGLLPMPGGAIFSAPLVDQCDEEQAIEPLLKTKINYWFRHVWEYWWPLYPGVLLTVDLTGLPIVSIMLLQLPLSLVSIMAGYFFLLRKIEPGNTTGREIFSENGAPFIRLIMPVIIIIATYALVKILFPAVGAWNRYLPMCIGILLAQVYLQVYRHLSLKSWGNIILSGNALKLVILVVLILIYGSFISARLPDGSLLVTQMRSELAHVGIPVLLVVVLIPFICGFITGIAIGFVGASFPIVLSLIGVEPSMAELLATTVLAYGAGYTGMILSPVHICLIVTNEHFKTGLGASIIRLIRPGMAILAASVGMYFLVLSLF